MTRRPDEPVAPLGGYDVVLDVPLARAGVEAAVRAAWPAAVFEAEGDELFAHRDPGSALAWEFGEPGGETLHVVFGAAETTFAVARPGSEAERIALAIELATYETG